MVLSSIRTSHLIAVGAFLLATSALAEVDTVEDLPGADRPSVGRSLFDHLIATPGGTTMDVPFPIGKLINALEQKTGVKPKVIMVPKGRSLQRDTTDFEKPRIIFAFDEHQKQTADDLGGMIKDRLYLAFAERANQLEVVSYNAAAGRYEFQVVGDYREGGAKKLAYASRGLCTKCHHNGSPIFSNNPWPETNGVHDTDHKLADLIAESVGSETFHGFPVRTSREGAPYDIDKSVERSNFVIPYQKLWKDGCGGATAEGTACRANVLRLALEMIFNSPARFTESSPAYQALAATWATTWPGALQGGLKIPDPKLIDFFPLDEAGASSGFADLGPGLSPEESTRIRLMLASSEVPHDKDPLFQLLGPKEIWTLDSICYGKCLIYGVNRFFTDADKVQIKQAGGTFAKVSTAIDEMLAANSPAFENRAFRRAFITKALLKQLGAAVPKGGAEDDVPAMPEMVFDAVQAPASGPPIALMKAYCLPCHAELPGTRSFLRGTDAEINSKSIAQAGEIYKRMNWESAEESGHAHMPPKSTEADSAYMHIKGHDDHRLTIKAWAQCIIEPASCAVATEGGH